jgi:SAM-dependent methyltransferase
MEACTVAPVSAAQARSDTRQAFDGVASTYDSSNAANPLLRAMRDRTRAALQQVVHPTGRLLDLGCGPGTDVVYFAARGYDVTAIDWSPGMVREARSMVRAAGLDEVARVEQLGIDDLDELDADPFDAAYSSFGPLNCVTDLPHAARAIRARLRPGGVLVASIIGRICPWEIALYLSRRDWQRATVRFTRTPVPVPLEGRTVWMQYWTPAEVSRAFADAGFRRRALRTLGLVTPPPYLQAFADRHPRLIAKLQQLEDAVATWPRLRAWGDHFLIVMERR